MVIFLELYQLLRYVGFKFIRKNAFVWEQFQQDLLSM